MPGPWEHYQAPAEDGPWAKYQASPAAVTEPPMPTMGDVALQAVPKGIANFLNTPITAWNLAKLAATGMHPQIKEYATPTPNYPMQAMEAMGLIDPTKAPQTAGQRIVDTAIQAAVPMVLAPQTGLTQMAKNVGTGLASGAAAQTTKEATGSDLLAMAVGTLAPLAISGVRSPTLSPTMTDVGKQTLKDAQTSGYVVQPSTVRPSLGTAKLESVAGKAAVAQDAAVRNQAVTNRLAATAIGLPEDTPLTMTAIESVRAQAAKPYQEVAALSPKAGKTLDKLRQARADATLYYRHYERSADPASLKQAQALSAKADRLESTIDNLAKHAGKPELLEQLQAARMLYARTYDIERALNLGDGNISAPILGRMLDQGRPLTGELKVIGKFAQAFPRVAREGASVPPPSVSGTDAASAALLGTLGYGAAGGPGGLLAAGLPLLRGPARNLALSSFYQRRLLREPPPIGQTLTKSGLIGSTLADYFTSPQETP